MNKKILIGSILAVALLTLVSLSNVVGYQSVKNTQEDIITSSYDFDECKEYLFETLVDISNNPEVKDLINSNNHNLFPSNTNNRMLLPFRRYNNKVSLSVEHLELMYNLGLKIMDRLGEDKVAELMETISIDKPEFAEELDTIIMGNNDLKDRIYNLNEMTSRSSSIQGYDDYPRLCAILRSIIDIGNNIYYLAEDFRESGFIILSFILSVIFNAYIVLTAIPSLLYMILCEEPHPGYI